jgi:hypothetical protein
MMDGSMALKNTAGHTNASPVFVLVDDSKAENPDQDEVDRDDDVEQSRDYKNENSGDQCDDRL